MSTAKLAINIILLSVALGGGLVNSYVVSPIAYKTLTFEQFSKLQGKVFPIYFLGQTLIPVAIGLTSPLPLNVVGPALAVSSIAGALNLFWALPMCRGTMDEKRKLEAERLHEATVDGKVFPSEEYRAVSRRFGMYHGISSLLNLVSLLSLVAYTVFLGRLR